MGAIRWFQYENYCYFFNNYLFFLYNQVKNIIKTIYSVCSFIEKRLGKDGGIGKKIEKFRSLTMGIENYIVMRETASDKWYKF